VRPTFSVYIPAYIIQRDVLKAYPKEVSHANSVGERERMNESVCPLNGPGLIPGRGRVFQGIFP